MVAAMSPLPPGSRVLVTWNDGRVYQATVSAFAQGLAKVRWDGGATSAWVPLANVRPLDSGAAAPVGAPPSGPAPSTWNAYPAYSGGRTSQAPPPGVPSQAGAVIVQGVPVYSSVAGGQGAIGPSGAAGQVASGPSGVVGQAASGPSGAVGASALVGSPVVAVSGPASGPQPGPMSAYGGGAQSGAPSAYGGGVQSSLPSAQPSGPPSNPASVGRGVPPSIASAYAPLSVAAASHAPPRLMSGLVDGLPRGLVYEPTGPGPGAGQAFFIFFGFVTSADGDAAMRMTDIDHLGDDVAALRAAGYRVIVDLHADAEGLNAALAGTHPEAVGAPVAGVFWGSHGEEDGTIEDCQGFRITPEQIGPEAARRGTCKLFVMSACCTGHHCERWQKALGSQATIIAWGAPLTNDRAIDFLTPDDESSKDFDDLLDRHLGAKRVAADGPLVEARELARRHEDKLATLLLGFDELVEAAHKRLGCPMQRGKRGDAYFTVRTPSSKERPEASRAQIVRVAPVGMADSFLLVSSLVGPYSDALDLARGLRTVSPALHLRLAIARISPPEQDFVVVETLFRRRRLDPITLSRNISAVGAYADRLEDLFFGSDQR